MAFAVGLVARARSVSSNHGSARSSVVDAVVEFWSDLVDFEIVPVLTSGNPTLAPSSGTGHTATMNLKNAALLAFVGTLLLTLVAAVDFIRTISGVLGGFVPAMALLRSTIYLFASLTVTVFFYVFNRPQSR